MGAVKNEFWTEIEIEAERRNGRSPCPECGGAGTDGTDMPWSGFDLDECYECGGEGFVDTHPPERDEIPSRLPHALGQSQYHRTTCPPRRVVK